MAKKYMKNIQHHWLLMEIKSTMRYTGELVDWLGACVRRPTLSSQQSCQVTHHAYKSSSRASNPSGLCEHTCIHKCVHMHACMHTHTELHTHIRPILKPTVKYMR